MYRTEVPVASDNTTAYITTAIQVVEHDREQVGVKVWTANDLWKFLHRLETSNGF